MKNFLKKKRKHLWREEGKGEKINRSWRTKRAFTYNYIGKPYMLTSYVQKYYINYVDIAPVRELNSVHACLSSPRLKTLYGPRNNSQVTRDESRCLFRDDIEFTQPEWKGRCTHYLKIFGAQDGELELDSRDERRRLGDIYRGLILHVRSIPKMYSAYYTFFFKSENVAQEFRQNNRSHTFQSACVLFLLSLPLPSLCLQFYCNSVYLQCLY